MVRVQNLRKSYDKGVNKNELKKKEGCYVGWESLMEKIDMPYLVLLRKKERAPQKRLTGI